MPTLMLVFAKNHDLYVIFIYEVQQLFLRIADQKMTLCAKSSFDNLPNFLLHRMFQA